MTYSLAIERKRGDTHRIRISFVHEDTGAALDLTGASLLMTVSPIPEPDEGSDTLFTLAGSIVAPATDGVADFFLDSVQADNVGEFYYDVEMTDVSGAVRTILEGPFTFTQDITKSDEVFEWTPPTAPNDGDGVVRDGSVDVYIAGYGFPENTGELTYQTRDTRRVIRFLTEPGQVWELDTMTFLGPAFPRRVFTAGFEWKVTAWVEGARWGLYRNFPDGLSYFAAHIDTRLSAMTATLDGTLTDETTGERFNDDCSQPSTSGWTDGAWFQAGLRVASDGKCYGMIKREADDDDWVLMFSTATLASCMAPFYGPETNVIREIPENASAMVDIWKVEWRRV